LNKPIIDLGVEEINKKCDEYCLVPYDWSHLDYKNHNAKKDLISKRRSNKTTATSNGYDLQGSIALSDRNGSPITPLHQNLKTSKKVYSTYDYDIDLESRHLEELTKRSKFVNEKLNIEKKIVDIVDREGDSISLFRDYHKDNRLYLVRAKDKSTLFVTKESLTKKDQKLFEKNNFDFSKSIQQKRLANQLSKGKYYKTIKYQKQNVKIYVNECEVTITRDANKVTVDENKKLINIQTPGKSITNRFIIVKLIDDENEIVTTWMLFTNVDKKVTSNTIAKWYTYRWNIESYFKLLKSTGFNLEIWQEEKPLALFKRLLVVSYACTLIWQIQHSNRKDDKQIKQFLTQVSGKLIQRGVETTTPALLSGLFNLLSTLDILDKYSISNIMEIKGKIEDLFGFRLLV
jgi:hypothetical protein